MNSIILVYGVHNQSTSRWDSISNLQWCKEQLPAQHTKANIKAYRFDDLDMQASPIGMVEQAAKDLLSELDGSKGIYCTSSSNNRSDTEDLSSLDPKLPVFFICQGFAGLVVKRVLLLSVLYILSSFS